MKTKLKVVADQLREIGQDDIAQWVERADAVRELLKHEVGLLCPACKTFVDEFTAHSSRCPIVTAWHQLNTPAFDRELQHSETEARTEHRLREAGILEHLPQR